jgi:hypothetical protein
VPARGEFIDLLQTGVRDAPVVGATEHPEDGPHLTQRLRARLLDGYQRLPRPLRPLVEHVRGDTGLDVDDRDGVRDGVVDLTRDPKPFGVDPCTGLPSRVRSANSARA